MIHGNEASIEPVRLHELFERQADLVPTAPALYFDGQTVSYRRLDVEANRLAHRLARLDVTRGCVVVICLPPGPGQLVAVLATLKAGAAYLPLEPAAPRHRTAAILSTAGASAVITEESLAEQLARLDAPLLRLDADAELIARESGRRPAIAGTPDDLAYVLYTSGSTGVPKGVEIEHRSVVNYASWANAQYELGRGHGCPMYTPLSFDLTMTSIFCPLLAGRRVHILRDPGGAGAIGEVALTGSYSMVKLTPAHVQVFDYMLTPEQVCRLAPRLVIGGEQLYGEMLGRWRREAPETIVVNEYGPTEATVGCCAWNTLAGKLSDGAVPIGRPIANTSLYVVRPDDPDSPCPQGEPGELLIGGHGVARGYRGDPELTARKFVENRIDARWPRLYRTGDVVSVRIDGVLEYLRRTDDQLKVRGYRVEPGEIEAVLRQHPDVRSAVVAPVSANGVVRLAGYLTWTPDGCRPPDRGDLVGFLGSRLPPYMIPDVFYRLDALPLTAGGKLNRRAMAGMAGRLVL